MRYQYTLVRYVPEPVTGEFINVGVVAGSFESGDWAFLRAQKWPRLANAGSRVAWKSANEYLSAISGRLDETSDEVTSEWLNRLITGSRSVLQFSGLVAMSADSAEDAAKKAFKLLVRDPEPATRANSGARARTALRHAYSGALDTPETLLERVSMEIEGNHEANFDFAVANGRVVQLATAWSFDLKTVDRVANGVKAWGYSIGLLRDPSHNARITFGVDRSYDIPSSIDIEAIYVPPRTSMGEQALEQSLRVFDEMEVLAVPISEVDAVADRANQALLTH